MADDEIATPRKRRRWGKRKQCRASSFVRLGGSTVTDYCTRERGHEGPHANAFTQTAWVVTTVAQPVTYRWPYEDLRVDTTISQTDPDYPHYHGKSTLITLDMASQTASSVSDDGRRG